jgi:hypothetical protein
MIVKVYRNLKHGRSAAPLYSVLYKGKVIARKHRVLLRDAHFIVNEAGRRRVLESGHKNVHAFVVGTLTNEHGCFGIDADGNDFRMRVTYDPRKGPHFVTATAPVGRIVKSALGVLLNERGISACYLETA